MDRLTSDTKSLVNCAKEVATRGMREHICWIDLVEVLAIAKWPGVEQSVFAKMQKELKLPCSIPSVSNKCQADAPSQLNQILGRASQVAEKCNHEFIGPVHVGIAVTEVALLHCNDASQEDVVRTSLDWQNEFISFFSSNDQPCNRGESATFIKCQEYINEETLSFKLLEAEGTSPERLATEKQAMCKRVHEFIKNQYVQGN